MIEKSERYEVNATDEFERWWLGLAEEQQEAVSARIALLEIDGPALGRPVVDQVKGSAFHNMKELRCSSKGALRVLFVFDPRREAILLLGGDKSGNWEAWYRSEIPKADALYVEYLRDLREKGLIE